MAVSEDNFQKTQVMCTIYPLVVVVVVPTFADTCSHSTEVQHPSVLYPGFEAWNGNFNAIQSTRTTSCRGDHQGLLRATAGLPSFKTPARGPGVDLCLALLGRRGSREGGWPIVAGGIPLVVDHSQAAKLISSRYM